MAEFVGKDVADVPKPAAVLDVARVRRHCHAMLDAVQLLGVGFRAHVKTHKTIEGTEMQLGDSKNDARLVVSTVAELEFLLPLLEKYVRDGRPINVLYGIPLPPSQVSRIAEIAQRLGPQSLTFMIDHPSQLHSLGLFRERAGFAPGIYVKVDTGYHRAGLPAASINKGGLIDELSSLEAREQIYLVGLYSHSSLSYSGVSPRDALDSMVGEIAGCVDALRELRKHYKSNRVITVSVGASPQATAMQNLLDEKLSADSCTSELQDLVAKFAAGEVEGVKVSLEIHAGVYSILDLQQLATRSTVARGEYEDEIALSVMAEVVSVYNDGERRQPEILIAAGVLALGREPCQGYPGWGVVSTRNHPSLAASERRLFVARISQEHAILSWEVVDGEDPAALPPIPLEVGQNVFVYPNHACVTGAMHKSYFVIDTSKETEKDQVMAVWQRASGW